jgi:Icc-related predicted phosphoesterase
MAKFEKLRVQVLSDLHSEMAFDALPLPAQVETQADIVVLAGDTDSAGRSVAIASKLFPTTPEILMIAGNHEHYGTRESIEDGIQSMRAQSAMLSQPERRISVLEDNEIILDVKGTKVRILGCTLWTDYNLYGDSLRDRKTVECSLNDYRMITSSSIKGYDGHIRSEELLSTHRASVDFLCKKLSQIFDGPTIVITHHLPSICSVSTRFRKNHVSAGFASNLDNIIEMGATLWIHGHTHDSCIWRAKKGGTLVVCNPAGYARWNGRENVKFDPKLVINIRRGGPGSEWQAGIERKTTLAKKTK